MGLEYVRRTYEAWGEDDPMYAVLTSKGRKGGGWSAEELFAHGEREIAALSTYLEGLGLRLGGERALDFGCGVGRLTQALAERFEEVVGVDIAESMVRTASEHNRHGSRVRYLTNVEPHLGLLPDAYFDFVYSNIALQHIPPRFVVGYIAEFFRVARPGALVVFQMRSGRRIEPGTVRSLLYRINREHFRHLLQRLRRRPPYEIHFLARARVEEVVRHSRGVMLAVRDLSNGRGKSFLYTARAQAAAAGPHVSGASDADDDEGRASDAAPAREP